MRVQPQATTTTTGTTAGTTDYALLEKEPINVGETFQAEEQQIQKQISEVRLALRNSPEVQHLSKQINVQNKNEVLEFGQKPAEEISKFADRILNSTKRSDLEDSTQMLKKLSKVMERFDSKEFENDGNGVLAKLFNSGKKQMEKLFNKYQTMGKEIDGVYTEIETYRKEMMKTNDTLEELYMNLFKYYEALEKYIVAGMMVVEEMKAQDLPFYEEKARSGQQEDILMLENVRDIINALEDRVYNLEMAKMAAFQTAPQIRLMQRTNGKLISKIHSAFIVTIPIFKANLIQAITLKRSRMINDSLNVLEEQTNRMLRENAQNTIQQGIAIARDANNPMVRIEVLEENMNTIINGMQEIKAIEEEKEKMRADGLKRVHELQQNYELKRLESTRK